jgi:hypothetical protein
VYQVLPQPASPARGRPPVLRQCGRDSIGALMRFRRERWARAHS